MTEPSYLDAVRVAYDTVAADYAELLRDELGAHPLDRAVLVDFVDLVAAAPGEPVLVADLGCGPGRVAAHLLDRGLDVIGIDVSPSMIAEATATYPDLAFRVGDLGALDLADGALAGAVCWYSIIHIPPDQLAGACAELHRVLRPGGVLLVAFQVGDRLDHLDHAYGHDVELDVYRRPVDEVLRRLRGAGFEVTAELVREPVDRERHPQAFVVARRPTTTA